MLKVSVRNSSTPLFPFRKLLPTLNSSRPEKEMTGRRSWGWLDESNPVHLIAAGAVSCHCSTSCMVCDVIRHFSDLGVSWELYESNAGTRLQFLALCSSRLCVLLVMGSQLAHMLPSLGQKRVPGKLAKLSWGCLSTELSYSCYTKEGGPRISRADLQSQVVAPGLPPALVGQSSLAAEPCCID